MGKTLAHEHFNWIFDEDFALRMYFDKKYDESYNLKIFNNVLPMLNELGAAGCQTIVEASPPLGGQNLKLLYDLSIKSNINIIPCTGMNITKYAYGIFKDNFELQLANKWIKDFEEGLDIIDNISIKPGFIKLLLDRGCVNAVDTAMLKAAVLACKVTGMPIHCHVLEAEQMSKVIRILEEMQVPPNKFLWAHADHEGNLEMILKAIKKGYWVGFDTITKDTYENRVSLIKHAVKSFYQWIMTYTRKAKKKMELKGTVPFSINLFPSVLKWGSPKM